MRRRLVRRRSAIAVAATAVLIGAPAALASGGGAIKSFAPLTNWNVPGGGVAEIVAATPDGKTLYYTDSSAGAVGVVDISRPKSPNQLTTIDVGGEPTSVAITKDGKWAVVSVQTSTLEEGEVPVLRAGKVVVIDLAAMTIAKEITLAGSEAEAAGPDSVATGELGGRQFAVVAVENEPVIVDGDGKLTDGEDPGDPNDISAPGNVQVIDLGSDAVHKVDLPADPSLLFPDDPQPEYVDVSGKYAAVSLQENNGMAVIDAEVALQGNPAGAVTSIFSTGTASQRTTDLKEDERIDFADGYPSSVASEDNAGARAADAIAFTRNGKYILSADEGEQNFTGGRGWSMWTPDGTLIRDDRGKLEDESVRIGQFPEDRAENKGIEVEGIETGVYGNREFYFVGSERGSFVGVYRARKNGPPRLVQTLPTGVAPEGLVAIPNANLLVTADEKSGNLTIFRAVPYRYRGTHKRPLLRSRSDEDGFAAISGLSGDPRSKHRLWGVPDSALKSELYRINLRGTQARLSTRPITKDGKQQAYDLEGITADTSIEGTRAKRAETHRRANRRAQAQYRDASRRGKTRAANRAQRLMTYHGAQAKRYGYRGGFWLAQEGNAKFGESAYRPNLLVQVDRRGRVTQEISLPPAIDSPGGGVVRKNGFEGIAVSDDGRSLLAVIQREYEGEPQVGGRLHTRIAKYDLMTEEWEFFLYPLDLPPAAGGWVGLSEIVNLGGDRYAVIERDKEQGGAAEVKRIYQFSLDDVESTDGQPLPAGTTPEDVEGKVIRKHFYADVLDEFAPFEKIEGLAVAGHGRNRVLWGNVDNDGGGHESRLVKLGRVKPAPKPSDKLTLSLLHHNDGESDLLPGDDHGGVARFGTIAHRAKGEAYSEYGERGMRSELLVSAGDNILPGKELNASLSLPPGSPFYDAVAYDLIKYDAMVIGNHDFDLGPDVLEGFIRSFRQKSSGSPARSRVPFLSANLDVSAEPGLKDLQDRGRIAKSTIVKVRGYRIGIIGATTPNLPFISSPRNVVVDTMVAPAVQGEIDRLRTRKVDKIILASHLQGVDEDIDLLTKVEGVDAAVAGGGDELLANADDELLPGDTPTRPYPILAKDKTGKDVPVVTAPGQYQYLGRLVIEFDEYGDLVMVHPDSGPIANFPEGSGKEVKPRADIQNRVVQPVTDAVAAIDSNVLGQATVDLEGSADAVRSGETNLGNFTADAILDKANELAPSFGTSVDVAIQNGGGIRDSVATGNFTEGKTFDIFPFGNTLTVVEDISAAELKEILENAVSKVVVVGGQVVRQGSGTGRFAQVAGLTYSYDPTAQPRTFDSGGAVTNPGSRVIDVALADGTPLITGGVPEAGAPSINLAINSFNAGGGDQYPVLTDKNQVGLGLSTQQALAEFVTEQSPIGAAPYNPGVNDRIFPIFS